MRVAFLTPEYVFDYPSSGGLASYVARIAGMLTEMGHSIEVFTLSDRARIVDHDGVRVEHVVPSSNIPLRLLGGHWRSGLLFSSTIGQLSGAQAMGRALKHRELTNGFDLVQSSDYGLSGAYVSRRANRPHVIRCSWSRKLYQYYAGLEETMDTRLIAWQERHCLHRSDIVYAPSSFMADAVSREFHIPVRTIRPPLMSRFTTGLEKSGALPDRYMIHFGQLSRIKGTDILIEALPAIWDKIPNFHLVLAGKVQDQGLMNQIKRCCGRRIKQIHLMGSMPRPQLYGVIQHAQAAILPSRCDNLPNTVIESLCLGVPVIGSDGASIDELVTHNKTGKLVPIADVGALAEAVVEQWHHPLSFTFVQLKQHATFIDMVPEVAATSLLDIAKETSTRRFMKAA